MLPKPPSNYAQERRGVNAVAAAAARIEQIWRETDTADVGIDGQLEFVNASGFVTGQTVAVQVKSGPSFFEHDNDDSYSFYPEAKHRGYWERYPLPVLLVLHNPEQGRSCWVDARQALRTGTGGGTSPIRVPKANVLEEATAAQLFETAGVPNEAFIENIEHVLQALLSRRSGNASFPVSHFDLFVHGLTNICRSIYFGMDVAMIVAEASLARAASEFGVGVGPVEHEFLFDFVKFLVSQNLAFVDYADCLIETDRGMQPQFVAPLTSRGRALVLAIGAQEDRLVAAGGLPSGKGLRVAQEGFFEMVVLSYVRRLDRIAAFQEAIAAGPATPAETAPTQSPVTPQGS
jgi:hypothetical protein